jgi:hypothetical protein
MLRDPKARALAENFTGQWLGTKRLHTTVSPDRRRFPQYTDALRDAMAAEPIEFFGSLLAEDASLLRLLDADYTFANADLGKFYGLTNVTATNLVRVPLTDRNRGGIIGMAAVLTQTSYPLRTSPVLRGRWILEEVLGTPPPPPPPLVATLPADDKVKEGLTFRQRLEKHRENKNCAACHDRLDPMGFALENFDAIGRWRDKNEAGVAIDSAGKLPTGTAFSNPAELKRLLAGRESDIARNLTERFMAYALGRPLEGYDEVVIDQLMARIAGDEYKVRTILTEVIASYLFTHRRVEE